MPSIITVSHDEIKRNISTALKEDIGTGDITAQLIDASSQYSVNVITREKAVICGVDWVNETFQQVDPSIAIEWQCQDGESKEQNTTLFKATGNARSILTAERTALNFLQMLSGTASCCHRYAQRVAHTGVKLLDTRKTIPGLRQAQKYAVHTGGCFNHRIGLYDAFLIKENHIAACGSIQQAVTRAKQQADKPIEVEVENFAELNEALTAKADIIMLDNFSVNELVEAVQINNGQAKLEASGNIHIDNIASMAETGVDYISIGALTKHVQAIDLSMRFMH